VTRRSGRHATLSGLVAAAAAAALAAAAGGQAAPYVVAVDLAWSDSRGPERLRADLERELLRSLAEADCFATVRRLDAAEGEPDLVLRVILDRYREELEYDVALADRLREDPLTDRGRGSARIEAYVSVHLLLAEPADPAAAAPVRSGSFRQVLDYTALQEDEDPRPRAEADFVDELVRRVRRLACKGDAERLRGEIERARPAVH
jgi:hypothetical protein